MIKVISYRGKTRAPIVVCDQCGLPITDCQDGNALWKIGTNGVSADGLVYFTHKRCNRLFEASNKGNYYWAGTELGAWLVYLVHNMKANSESVRENARMLEMI